MNALLIPITIFVSLGILLPFVLVKASKRQVVESNRTRWRVFAERLGLSFKDSLSDSIDQRFASSSVDSPRNTSASKNWLISGSIDGVSIYLSQVYGSATNSHLGITLELMYTHPLPFELYIASKQIELEEEDLAELDLEKLEVRDSELESRALLYGKPKLAAEKWASSSLRSSKIIELLTEHPAISLTEEGADEFIAGDFGRATIESGDLKDEEWLERKIRSIASILRSLSQ